MRLRRSGQALSLLVLASSCQPEQKNETAKPFPLAVAFQPRGFSEIPRLQYPTQELVTEDLVLLRRSGFRSLVTYGAANVLGRVPQLARSAGFDGMIVMGIWDPFSEEERANALNQVSFVDAYCIGNEGLGIRYRPGVLAPKMHDLRKLTRKPVTTSEPLSRYIEGPDHKWLTENSDWLFPIAHPYLAGHLDGPEAIQWVVTRHDYLRAASGKTVILKEIGFPTHGAECCNEDTQLDFFRKLSATGIRFFFFEAFDQPHKRAIGRDPEPEHHWGLYKADGSPKKVVGWLPELEVNQ